MFISFLLFLYVMRQARILINIQEFRAFIFRKNVSDLRNSLYN